MNRTEKNSSKLILKLFQVMPSSYTHLPKPNSKKCKYPGNFNGPTLRYILQNHQGESVSNYLEVVYNL